MTVGRMRQDTLLAFLTCFKSCPPPFLFLQLIIIWSFMSWPWTSHRFEKKQKKRKTRQNKADSCLMYDWLRIYYWINKKAKLPCEGSYDSMGKENSFSQSVHVFIFFLLESICSTVILFNWNIVSYCHQNICLCIYLL